MTTALTIAGSDSGGGAGIQADLKTFHQFGVYGTSVIVAITAQNTLGVSGIHSVPAKMVRLQIEALRDDLPPAAFKTGMLGTVELVETVARAIDDLHLPNYVLDPVMVATSGDRLLEQAAEAKIRELLVPRSLIVTPNTKEADLLAGIRIPDVAAMEEAARSLVDMGARAALVKGGHMAGNTTVDVLFDGDDITRFEHERIDTRSTHGTGCTLSAAITAGLALGTPLVEAVRCGLDYVHQAIKTAPGIGAGNGPLNHFGTPQ